MNGNVVIIGAGIAGLTTAIGLRRAGIDAEVHEARDRPTAEDNSLAIAANGLRALGHLDCIEPVLERGFLVSRMSVWSGRGKRLGTIPFAGSEYGDLAGLAISRTPLIEALTERARDLGAPITYGRRLVDAGPEADGVLARFDDGSTATGTTLIGADGEYSRVRRIIDPDAPAPRYAGLVECGGYTDAAMDLPSNEITMIFGRRAFFGCGRGPGGRTWWFANVPTTPEPSREELRSLSSGAWKRRLLELFADDAGPARSIIEMTEGPLRPRVSRLLPPAPVWHRDRMMIIGDAAHCASPNSGQGASMAIEDAVVLSGHLRASDSIDAAFRGYENARRDRVDRVVRYGARSARSKALGPIARVAADALMPFMFRRIATHRTLDWLYDYDAAAGLPTPV
ncbi:MULTISPECIES: FAD-dependent monooxygenase [unclassified Nocardia]|uniref:FAD-dependent monooxygenase n=1 Tax=unclassified Nocardia TaxID=2637762 RepID=UPI001CE4782A|nr:MULTISPECIES: FAD-dependent monooxygenase [unclassified Nocardia]